MTKYVAEFVTNTSYANLPEDVLALGKKSILDGLGLALASGRSKGNEILLGYIRSLGVPNAGATLARRTCCRHALRPWPTA